MAFMTICLLFLPLLGASFTGFFGYKIGSRGAAIITTSCITTSLCIALLLFYETLIAGTSCWLVMAPWITPYHWGLQLDILSVIMAVVVTGISTLVHFYSIEYMQGEPRFLAYIGLFTFFMLVLITATNLIQLFLGWEGVGLCSYLLINYWYTRIQANKAAIKAMFVNKIGDVSVLVGIALIIIKYRTVDFEILFLFPGHFAIAFLLFIGVCAKSAQIGLHFWLPAAMEGPTPVSALIHAATMVTAGVFLLARCSKLFTSISSFIIIIGAITTIYGGCCALGLELRGSKIYFGQHDIKKIIAYSTISQLGYMVLISGVGMINLAIYHLVNHAFFKALLFLSAGALIHAINEEQDIRRMGGLYLGLNFIYVCTLIGSFAMIGIPGLSGYYSKDLILHLAPFISLIAVFLTAAYTMRILSAYITSAGGIKHIYEFLSDDIGNIGLVIGILSVFSIFIGWIIKDFFIIEQVGGLPVWLPLVITILGLITGR